MYLIKTYLTKYLIKASMKTYCVHCKSMPHFWSRQCEGVVVIGKLSEQSHLEE